MARWLLPAVCGLALIGAWKLSRAQPASEVRRVAEVSASSTVSVEASGETAEFVPGLEDLAKDADVSTRREVATAEPKIVLEPKPVETSKLHKDAKLGGALDLVEAHRHVAPLYSTKPYVSILPQEGCGIPDEAPDVANLSSPVLPGPIFEKDESYGRFECPASARSTNTTENDPGYNRFFGSVSFGIVIPH